MARILLGWELGGGQGHKVRLAAVARELLGRGHEAVVALQRTDIGELHLPDGAAQLRAPLWPGLAKRVPPDPQRPSASMGDILARLGLCSADTTEAMVRGWDEHLTAVQPDAVIADYAPMLLVAAHGRVPTLTVGGGFALPPAEMESFPSLSGQPKRFDEDRLLEAANAGLAAAGRGPLPSLPSLFASDAALVAPFEELDPYRGRRRDPAYVSEAPDALPAIANGSGDELFVYGGARFLRSQPLWEALRLSGLKVRVHVPGMGAALAAALRRIGMVAEPSFVRLGSIAERSRLIVNHGGLGMVTTAMLTGIPLAILHYDLEKRLIAEAATGLGLGIRMPLGAIAAERLAADLVRAAEDQPLAARSRRIAAALRARLGTPLAVAAANWADALR